MQGKMGLFLGGVILMGAVLGGILGEPVSAGPPEEDPTEELLKTFSEALATIQAEYAQEVSSEDLVESAIRGMLRTLDPHSSFFSRKDYDRLQEEQQGKYYGLGITIRAEAPGSGRVVVVEPPAPGTPAYRAGMRAGDVIARIEGEPIDDWDVNEQVIPNLKGPRGTTVNITVERLGASEPLDLTVGRDEIPIYTIKFAFRASPDVGYIRIDRFAETTGRELEQALDELDESTLGGLILDLRNNPGGALSQALEVSDRFLKKGQTIVSTKSRHGRERPFVAERGGNYQYPMVVLINGSSASASEIVSGALQDHDRALIVGENSFGKALVQTIYPLDGNRGLALTTGRYYTPSDRLIQRGYSDSFWDYYNPRVDQADSGREEFRTDTGRVVYGGGGIMPDEVVELERFSRFVRRIQDPRKDLFRDFASKLFSGEIESDGRYNHPVEELRSLSDFDRQGFADRLVVTDEAVKQFSDYLREKKIQFGVEELEHDDQVVRNLIRQELLLLYFGDEERYRVALELDRQFQTALELLPKAETLLQKQYAANAKE